MKNILAQIIIFGPPYCSPRHGGKVKGGYPIVGRNL